jgi:hypothetical protein
MMTQQKFDKFINVAFAKFKTAGNELRLLKLPIRTVVVIVHTQGIIDNGGLRYFFENTYQENPPYSFFCKAYRRIGATKAADAIKCAAGRFPFKNPHLYPQKRIDFMNKNDEVDGDHPIDGLTNVFYKPQTDIWKLLKKYISANQNAFEAD